MLKIFKGDSTGMPIGKTVRIKVVSDIALTGLTVRFKYEGVVRDFVGVTSGDYISIAFTNEETEGMALGVHSAVLQLVDGAGRVRTLTNTLCIKVTSDVSECYATDSSQTEVRIRISVDWSDVLNKPATFPPSAHRHNFADINKPLSSVTDIFDMESTDWVLRKKVAELYSLLGGKVINND